MKPGSWARDLADLLLPSGCVACGEWVPAASALLCARCRSRLREPSWPRCPRCHHPRGTGRPEAPECNECREWPRPLTAARAAYVLREPASDVVHALKYEGWKELGEVVAAALAGLVEPRLRGMRSVVVPVPTTPARLRERGYNQAQVIAEPLGERLERPVLAALRRVSGGPSQTSLAPDARRRNVRGAFAPEGVAGRAVSGRHVLLVDDVLTTGATASEAASVLAALGARSVTLLAFARALPEGAPRSR